jgi:hypothetical protein
LYFNYICDAPPNFLMDSTSSPKGENNGRIRSCGMFLDSQHFGGRKACQSSKMEVKKSDKQVNAELEHFWCTYESRANTDSQDSPRPKLGGSHYLPPYSILCAWPRRLHLNVILSRDSQVGSFEIFKIGTLATLGAHNFLCRPLIKVRC